MKDFGICKCVNCPRKGNESMHKMEPGQIYYYRIYWVEIPRLDRVDIIYKVNIYIDLDYHGFNEVISLKEFQENFKIV